MRSDLEARVDALYAHVGRRVREARRRGNVTQADLAEAIGLTRSSIANLEAGRQRIPVHLFVWIAEILDVAPHELLPGSDSFDGIVVVPDLSEHLLNDSERMRDFVRSTIAKVAVTPVKKT